MLIRKFFLIQKFVIIFFLILFTSCLNSTNTYEFGELSSLALGKTDKAMDWHGFTELYEHIFYPLKNSPIRIFEIGIKKGGSLILWRDYFPNATVFGIDIGAATVEHIQFMVVGALIIFFLIVEPHGLARLWQIAKQKLRLWPFPY